MKPDAQFSTAEKTLYFEFKMLQALASVYFVFSEL